MASEARGGARAGNAVVVGDGAGRASRPDARRPGRLARTAFRRRDQRDEDASACRVDLARRVRGTDRPRHQAQAQRTGRARAAPVEAHLHRDRGSRGLRAGVDVCAHRAPRQRRGARDARQPGRRDRFGHSRDVAVHDDAEHVDSHPDVLDDRDAWRGTDRRRLHRGARTRRWVRTDRRDGALAGGAVASRERLRHARHEPRADDRSSVGALVHPVRVHELRHGQCRDVVVARRRTTRHAVHEGRHRAARCDVAGLPAARSAHERSDPEGHRRQGRITAEGRTARLRLHRVAEAG